MFFNLNNYKPVVFYLKMLEEWTYSRIDSANYCTARYYLRYVLKEKSLRLSAYEKGSLLHDLIEHFQVYFGTEEEIEIDKKDKKKKAKYKKKYFNREGFADYAKARWMQKIKSDERIIKKIGEGISWRDENEKWQIYNTLPKICRPLFDKLLEEGPPLKSELKFQFLFDGKIFSGRIDEIRMRDGKVVIRDYKSGSPWIEHMKLNYDPQLTFYNVGLCSLCFKSEKFAKSLGLEKVRKTFMGNPIFIYPEIEEEFFLIEALQRIEEADKEKSKPSPKREDFRFEEDYKELMNRRNRILTHVPEVIRSTKRTDNHFFQLLDMIEGAKREIMEGNISADSGRKCDICDMKRACEKWILERKSRIDTGELKNNYGQEFFSFVDPDFVKLKEKEKFKPAYEQKKLKFRKK